MYRAAFPINKELSVEKKFDAAQLMERKINIAINLPKEHQSAVETQRLKTDVYD